MESFGPEYMATTALVVLVVGAPVVLILLLIQARRRTGLVVQSALVLASAAGIFALSIWQLASSRLEAKDRYNAITSEEIASEPSVVEAVIEVAVTWLVNQRTSATSAATGGLNVENLSGGEDAAACQADIQCWGRQHAKDAALLCREEIDYAAPYRTEWDTSGTVPVFSWLNWIDSEVGAAAGILYVGDAVYFQEGNGSWTRMLYRCEYDASVGRVLSLSLEESRRSD